MDPQLVKARDLLTRLGCAQPLAMRRSAEANYSTLALRDLKERGCMLPKRKYRNQQ